MPQLRLTYDGDRPMQLRSFLRGRCGLSAQLVKRLKSAENGITRRGETVRAADLLMPGDELLLCWPESTEIDANPALSVPVVFASARVTVCGKPAGMPVHPSVRHREDTLANWYAAQYPGCAFHVLNRLDRNTSGLCLLARSSHDAHLLHGTVQKRYFALVPPGLTGQGTVHAPIARERDSVITRCVRADGRDAVTHYRVLYSGKSCTLVMLTPETGRTHQIRVHMAHIGFPLLGDDLYGGDCTLLHAHALHCGLIRFPHPGDGREMTLCSPLRPEMAALLPDSEWYDETAL